MKLEVKSNSGKKMERKKFFSSIALGFLGIFAAKNILFNMFSSRKYKIKKTNIKKNSRVKINPLAVSRNKTGANNG